MKTYTLRKDQHQQIIIKKSGSYTIKLTGGNSHVDILGAFHLQRDRTLDLDIKIIHASPHTSANTHIRTVLDDTSTAHINGTIIVKKGAQQTNSFLAEKVLLLSKTAKAHATPNLEIEADDVKCSHAATVGTIDEEQLFYLASRGVSKQKAKALIAQGFLQPVKEMISSSH